MIITSTISPSLRTGLRFLGTWPDMPYANVNRLTYILSIAFVQYFQYLYTIAHFKPGELQNLVDSLAQTMDYTLTIVRLLTLWKNRRVVREILVAVDTDWRECTNVDRYLQVMTTKADISHFGTNLMLSFIMIVAVLYLLGDYTISIVAEKSNGTSRLFPLKILFPFEAERSPIYELLFVVLFLHAMLNAYTSAILNSLIFSLVLHASGQIDIIRQGFKTISEKVSYNGSAGHTIGMLIERHKRVISFSKNLDKLFSFMALTQVFLDTFVSCCLGLIVVTSVYDKIGVDLTKTVFAYSAVTVEIFIFCFAGEYLSLKNKLLADAAYDSLWYNMSPNQGKNMLLIIMRSQKQLTISVGGMKNLSLEVFASIMKTSASYISVLLAMY